MRERLEDYQKALVGKPPEAILHWALLEFGAERLGLASSFGAEDQLLTHWLVSLEPKARIFTLDTGRQFEETYDCFQRSKDKWGIEYEVYLPDGEALAQLLSEKGPCSFYQSVENRKECCYIRKVQPLTTALNELNIWVTGQRKDQAVTRGNLNEIEWDQVHQIFKLNPLCNWGEVMVWEQIKTHKIPYNKLHDQGFPSIGCQPCTRKVAPGDDIRSGRWWWESPEHKECGLHNRPK
ncbi:MAG: phosphoadenosine phosphosulfate reductase [Candidatus Lambdaproteobacteria bacterium RIFOXYD2_FULL_50_16]|uniref:Adenosine 5'-phosphosulfate reductase n=1 Tax=Candidatus Lambdaproteobacteria bacterium RIFOXYD2_FULL_50_16 TaxID=1817772 RepID=A0A1F6G9F1_9PROT|nr:MAG: phosphoadenosine phosphosulfate reductase [Candidatus Lambdaproteobacteria bacterium RIFOXYD2_FULL_50_16]